MTSAQLQIDSKWMRIFLLMFILEIVLYYVIVSLPMSNQEANSLASSYSSLNQTIQTQASLFSKAMYIYTHNLAIALIGLLPFIGIISFGYSTYFTSRTLEALAVIQPSLVGHLSPQLLVTALLLYPHSWLELPAYALALTENFYIIEAIFRRRLRREYHRAVIVAILIAVQLFVAATVEATELQYPDLALYFWIPSALYLYLFYRLIKRLTIPLPY